MDNAPFYIGQKVVRTGRSIGKFIKGETYTISGFHQCKCGVWYVFIKELSIGKCKLIHETCGNKFDVPSGPWPGLAKNFSPIQHQYSDITSELASQVTIGDTADQPVRVLEN